MRWSDVVVSPGCLLLAILAGAHPSLGSALLVRPAIRVRPQAELTRPAAAAALMRYPRFRAAMSSAEVSQRWTSRGDACDSYTTVDGELQRLVQAGWLRIHSVPPANRVRPDMDCEAELTMRGRVYSQYFDPVMNAAGFTSSWAVTLATRQVVTITGVANPGYGNTRRVEFTWRWVPLPPGDLLGVNTQLHTQGVAMFEHYDDGWRVGRVRNSVYFGMGPAGLSTSARG